MVPESEMFNVATGSSISSVGFWLARPGCCLAQFLFASGYCSRSEIGSIGLEWGPRAAGCLPKNGDFAFACSLC